MRSLMICALTKYCTTCDQIEKNGKGQACSTCGDKRGVGKIVVVRTVGKRPLGKPRRRWEYNIKMDLHEVDGLITLKWISMK
jgi:hypothetical protein